MNSTSRGLTRRQFAALALTLPASPAAAAPAPSRPRTAEAVPAIAAPLLATTYSDRIDPSLYLVSEKFDGVRALWDGQLLRYRSGREVGAPASWLAALPRRPLDGELWLRRGRFDALSATVRRRPSHADNWRAVSYQVFELPGAAGPFSARAARIAEIVEADRAAGGPLRAVAQTVVADRRALQRRLEATVAAGGEGLMLHLASAPWTTGRSDVLMKLKLQLDAEALVVGHRAGTGRLEGLVGALELERPDGRRFLVGSGLGDADRAAPPPLGSTVTYRYRGLTPAGTPRFATFWRRRADE